MALWYEVSVRYDKMQENGAVKKVTEKFLADALSCTEAESRLVEEFCSALTVEYSISSVKKTKIAEIFFGEPADRYYMVKSAFITLDEKSGMEKKSAAFILVQAGDIDAALSRFREEMRGTMADYEVAGVTESAIVDVFPLKLANVAESG